MKNIIILGGTGSIGSSIVEELYCSKYHLIIVSLIRKKSKNTKNKSYYRHDLSNTHNVKKILNLIKSKHGFIENFINCAGIINRKNLLTEKYIEYQKVLNINFVSPMLIMKDLIKSMISKKRGVLINFSSQMSKIPHPNAGPSYEISKSSLVTFSRHIAFHYGKYNIRSNIISPGTIKSNMQSTLKKSVIADIKKKIPLKRFGKPNETAKLVKFLLSDDSSYITGADIKVAGGSILD